MVRMGYILHGAGTGFGNATILIDFDGYMLYIRCATEYIVFLLFFALSVTTRYGSGVVEIVCNIAAKMIQRYHDFSNTSLLASHIRHPCSSHSPPVRARHRSPCLESAYFPLWYTNRRYTKTAKKDMLWKSSRLTNPTGVLWGRSRNPRTRLSTPLRCWVSGQAGRCRCCRRGGRWCRLCGCL